MEGKWLNTWLRKLKTCKNNLKEWSNGRFKERKQEIDMLNENLGNLQLKWEHNVEEIKVITEKINN